MHLPRLGLAKATEKVYDSALSHFTSFCRSSLYLSCLQFPMICAIIVHCFESHKMQPPSRKALVAGMQIPLRYADSSVCSLLGNPSIGLLFDGLKKEQPKQYLPFSLPLVDRCLTLGRGVLGPMQINYWEPCSSSIFYGFLRCENSQPLTPLIFCMILMTFLISLHVLTCILSRSNNKNNSDRVRVSLLLLLQLTLLFVPRPPWPVTCRCALVHGMMDKGKAISMSWFTTRH